MCISYKWHIMFPLIYMSIVIIVLLKLQEEHFVYFLLFVGFVETTCMLILEVFKVRTTK